MAQKEIEVILFRQLASYLAMPIFIVDPDGGLVFYNEPAEAILGKRYEDTGEMPLEEWSVGFKPAVRGRRTESPLKIALVERRPVHGRLSIRGLDGVRRNIAATAFPLFGQAGRFLGAAAIFWETSTK